MGKTEKKPLENSKGKKDFKQVKRLRRNDLIADREKKRLMHKFKKEMRKENKKANFENQSKQGQKELKLRQDKEKENGEEMKNSKGKKQLARIRKHKLNTRIK